MNRHRYCKKLSNFISVLTSKVKKIDDDNLRRSLERINIVAKKRKFVENYFRKRLRLVINNCKSGFDVWKNIPNVKKQKGRKLLA